MHRWTALALAVCLLPSLTQAARRVSGEAPVTLTLALHYPVVVLFPEPIARVMGLGRADSGRPDVPEDRQPVSFDVFHHILMVALVQADAVGRLAVIGDSGTTYLLNFKPGSPGDEKVEVLSARASQGPSPGTKKPDAAAPSTFTMAAWLRALKLGQTLPGQQPATLPLPSGIDPRLTLLGTTSWSLALGLAQVLTVHNGTSEALDLDERIGEGGSVPASTIALTTWMWAPGVTIRLVHAEAPHLLPGAQTRILVLGHRSTP